MLSVSFTHQLSVKEAEQKCCPSVNTMVEIHEAGE